MKFGRKQSNISSIIWDEQNEKLKLVVAQGVSGYLCSYARYKKYLLINDRQGQKDLQHLILMTSV